MYYLTGARNYTIFNDINLPLPVHILLHTTDLSHYFCLCASSTYFPSMWFFFLPSFHCLLRYHSVHLGLIAETHRFTIKSMGFKLELKIKLTRECSQNRHTHVLRCFLKCGLWRLCGFFFNSSYFTSTFFHVSR